MVTTKKITIEYTQHKMRRESKHVTIKYQLNTKEVSKKGKEGQLTKLPNQKIDWQN